jgi:hypothetical protein
LILHSIIDLFDPRHGVLHNNPGIKHGFQEIDFLKKIKYLDDNPKNTSSVEAIPAYYINEALMRQSRNISLTMESTYWDAVPESLNLTMA